MTGFINELQSLTPLTVVIAFVLYTIYQFIKIKRAGQKDIRDDAARDQGVASEVILAYKEQVSQLKQQNREIEESFQKRMREQSDSFNEQVNKLSGRIGELTGQINEKNQQLNLFKQLFENRNPELEEFIKTSREATEAMMSYMEKSSQLLQEIHRYMQKVTNK